MYYQYEGVAIAELVDFPGGRKLTVRWTSTAGGAVTLHDIELRGRPYVLFTHPIDGPSDNYGVQMLNAAGHDILLGMGASRSTSDDQTEWLHESSEGMVFGVTDGLHSLKITSAGDSKSGLLELTLV
jgi:hypothetical protein